MSLYLENDAKYNHRSSDAQTMSVRYFTVDWLSMVYRLHQHSIGYTGDGFYRSKDPTNSIKVRKEHIEYTVQSRFAETLTLTL